MHAHAHISILLHIIILLTKTTARKYSPRTLITKRDSISRGSCFCERYIYYKNKFKTKRNEKLIRNTLCIMYTSLILSLNLAINLSPTLYHSLPLCNYSLNVCASSHSLVSPNPSTLSLSQSS